MLTWDLFKHYLLSRRAGALIRTVAWLCMAGVAIGVMALVVVISVMNGFNDQIRNRLLAVEPHLVVNILGVKQADELLTTPTYRYLQTLPSVQTQLYESQDVIVRTVDGLFGGAVARGVEPTSLRYILEETRKDTSPSSKPGKGFDTPPITEESTHLGPNEILVGIDLARSLGIFEGDKVTVIPPESLLLPAGEAPPFARVTVKGLITTNIADLDSKAIFYGRRESFQQFKNSASKVAGFELRLPNPNDDSGLTAELRKHGAEVTSWRERNAALFYALRLEKFAMGSVLALAALVASFSIVTVLVLLLMQKRKDIGLLMALGLSPKRARDLFIRLGLLLSGIGIGTGLVIGVVICLVVQKYPLPLLPDIYYDTTIPASVDPLFILAILVCSFAIAYLSAYFPAKRHTSESPSDCLSNRKAAPEV